MTQPRMRHAAVLVSMALALAISLYACAPKAVDAGTAADDSQNDTEASAASWSPDAECGICHKMQAGSAEDASCTAGFHTLSQGFTCTTCHADEATLTTVHEKADGKAAPKKLKKTEVNSALCLTCHKTDELVAATATSTVLTDSEGRTVNPHEAMGLAESHKTSMACISCHTGHEAMASETATKYCLSCHHANVYACGTCHK